MSPQSGQRAPAFPGTNNQSQFPIVNNQQKSPFEQTSGQKTPNAFNPATTPPLPGAFPQNQGTPISQPSNSFTPQTQLPAFPPMNGSSNGQIQLPTNVSKTEIKGPSAIFPSTPPGGIPAAPGAFPSAPPGFGN